MDVVLGANVTLTTLLDNPVYDYIVWNFNNGNAQVNVATQGKDKLTVNKKYQGRVSVDRATGNLILVGTTSADSGDYGITVLMADGVTQTAEIKLRVLGESFRWVPGPRVGDLDRPPTPLASFSLFNLARRIQAFCHFSANIWRSRASLICTLKRARRCLTTYNSFSSRKSEFTEAADRSPGHTFGTSVTDIPPRQALLGNCATQQLYWDGCHVAAGIAVTAQSGQVCCQPVRSLAQHPGATALPLGVALLTAEQVYSGVLRRACSCSR